MTAIEQTPDWPTAVRSRLSGGRVLGVDNSVWLYRTVPLAPVVDAASPAESVEPAEPLLAAFDELAAITTVGLKRRAASKGNYRRIHLLLVNLPWEYDPAPGPIAEYLADSYRGRVVDRRVLMFGVRLVDKIGNRGGLRAAVDSVVETLVSGGRPISDFDVDTAAVEAALTRSGLATPTHEEFAAVEAWWNHGVHADTPVLEHTDHLHVFSEIAAVETAAAEPLNCSNWPADDGRHAITFATVKEFDGGVVPVDSPAAWWVPALLAEGALAVSIRGLIEPCEITREELRRRKKQILDDLRERVTADKLERSEQDEMFQMVTAVEADYAGPVPPTLVDASVLVAFDGKVGDMAEVARGSGLLLRSMDMRQRQAWAETMVASAVSANPYLHDLPAQLIACSGLPSLSRVGDADGAQLGFTERDRQPVFLSPEAASKSDSAPLVLCAGSTGSGKLLTLDTPLPTPTGWITMGDLKVGDQVFGSDGSPCTVTFLSDVDETPDLFRITFSDGQTIDADRDHQWVVSGFRDRNRGRSKKRVAAISRWDRAQQTIAQLNGLAVRFTPEDMLLSEEIFEHVKSEAPDASWRTPVGISTALDFVGCPSGFEDRTIIATQAVMTVEKVDPVILFPVAATLVACRRRWVATTGGNAVRWADQLATRIAATDKLLPTVGPDQEEPVGDIVRRLVEHGAIFPHKSGSQLATFARAAGIQGRPGRAVVRVPMPPRYPVTAPRRVWSAPIAFKSLAMRVEQMYGNRPSTDADERILTTGDMLEEGIRGSEGHATFAVHIAEPVDGADVELPVDPYVLGAWLGDGSTGSGTFTQGAGESCTDADGVVDQDHLIDQITAAGYQAQALPSSVKTIGTRGLTARLRTAGVLGDKHIPAVYLRASTAQRLALLQGLMDTDGHISPEGACELTLCDQRLAHDAVELIRSLGIKSSIRPSDACITENDPDRPGRKRRRVTGTRWRMVFTTTTPVFRLPRKANRLPESVRETQQWNYIVDITPIPTRPGRCIQVDSPDSTYLAEGFIPTHNTVAMQWMADNFARMGRPTVIIDPKMGSDLSAAVLSSGGQVASLDSLAAADGVFDPIRFATSAESAAELASSMLMAVNPWGSAWSDYETPLMRALSFGVRDAGAQCVGEALKAAERAGHAPPEMVRKVFDLAEASPMFRACVGINPGTSALRISDGITLIKVGNAHLDLPDARAVDKANQQQRVALALVRMMVFGSAMALTGRAGVVMLDEAWVFLGSNSDDLEKLGRLARSQQVLPMLFTQRVSDAVDANLTGYISRGIILPLSDPAEAQAACELFGLEPTPERIARITDKATIGGGDNSHGASMAQPNWRSMRHLRDPNTGATLRGTVAIYADLAGRAVPVEIAIPQSFIAMASTNPDDIRRRLELGP